MATRSRSNSSARPNAARVAAEVTGEKVETSAPVSEDAPRRRGRPRKQPILPREPYVATDEGIALCAMVGSVVWGVAGPMIGLRELTDEEAQKLGRALDPLLWKYLPSVGDWQVELNAALCVLALLHATRKPKETENGGRAEGAAEEGEDPGSGGLGGSDDPRA